MSPASRAPGASKRDRGATDGTASRARYRALGPAAKRGAKVQRARARPLAPPDPDLAARIRLSQPGLRRRIEGHEAFANLVRAVNSTLDPAKIGQLVIDRVA